ncbi:hypothetical protein EV361DRAFT_1030664 [Lentinula raphanica]|uniref:Cytokinin riboside 5'-monophosphate phosphoribohydrolase n=1 Tax=Lentinula raphanica TaxID=153919 RepID=A0AA38UFL2_9AGAR|nr:hypothetical protein F5878DRAFT_616620 [Lentinula raphanica]KAJ3976015.1 hypothetical protein EV361DRAFT_1030664 [Lentinula raphanica]
MVVPSTQKPARSICVLCGGNTGTEGKYAKLADDLAMLFYKNNWRLVYGGSPRGIMGRVSRTLSSLGGEVIGIKPTPFLKYSNGKLPEWGYNELVPDIHTQKARMAELSDGYLFLPGGFGTLEEFCAFRMWRKLGIIQAPLIIYNFENFYDDLLKWIGTGADEGFISANAAAAFSITSSLEGVNEAFASCSYATDEQLDLSDMAPPCDKKYLGLVLPKFHSAS